MLPCNPPCKEKLHPRVTEAQYQSSIRLKPPSLTMILPFFNTKLVQMVRSLVKKSLERMKNIMMKKMNHLQEEITLPLVKQLGLDK